MQRPLKITARDFELTEPMDREIRERVEALERYFERISGCEVVVEAPVHHHRKGGPFRVRIRMTVPRGEIEVNHQAVDDLAVAIRDAFDAARRRLEDHVRELRRQVKVHAEAPHARVTKLLPEEGYGFITSPEGDEVYFHRNSVLAPGFDCLRIGSEVRFVQEMGEMGPQASSVAIIRPRRESKIKVRAGRAEEG
ncbi:MAG TPA: HPF/RaiA family ribosome-associated protein [Candidatus Binataceae bacterium]|nr:HPF/RaiA family ribosome-associated protein [Candidatus Binataceae bacterium]